MAILGLIALITASGVASWRQKAYETIALADAVHVSHLVALAGSSIAPGAVVDQQAINRVNASLTPGSRLIDPAKDETGRVTFCVEHHVGGEAKAYARYDSAEGGHTDRGEGACRA